MDGQTDGHRTEPSLAKREHQEVHGGDRSARPHQILCPGDSTGSAAKPAGTAGCCQGEKRPFFSPPETDLTARLRCFTKSIFK